MKRKYLLLFCCSLLSVYWAGAKAKPQGVVANMGGN